MEANGPPSLFATTVFSVLTISSFPASLVATTERRLALDGCCSAAAVAVSFVAAVLAVVVVMVVRTVSAASSSSVSSCMADCCKSCNCCCCSRACRSISFSFSRSIFRLIPASTSSTLCLTIANCLSSLLLPPFPTNTTAGNATALPSLSLAGIAPPRPASILGFTFRLPGCPPPALRLLRLGARLLWLLVEAVGRGRVSAWRDMRREEVGSGLVVADWRLESEVEVGVETPLVRRDVEVGDANSLFALRCYEALALSLALFHRVFLIVLSLIPLLFRLLQLAVEGVHHPHTSARLHLVLLVVAVAAALVRQAVCAAVGGWFIFALYVFYDAAALLAVDLHVQSAGEWGAALEGSEDVILLIVHLVVDVAPLLIAAVVVVVAV